MQLYFYFRKNFMHEFKTKSADGVRKRLMFSFLILRTEKYKNAAYFMFLHIHVLYVHFKKASFKGKLMMCECLNAWLDHFDGRAGEKIFVCGLW